MPVVVVRNPAGRTHPHGIGQFAAVRIRAQGQRFALIAQETDITTCERDVIQFRVPPWYSICKTAFQEVQYITRLGSPVDR